MTLALPSSSCTALAAAGLLSACGSAVGSTARRPAAPQRARSRSWRRSTRIQFARPADRRRPRRGHQPDQARRRAARPRAEPAGRRQVAEAGLVVYAKGFQPAVDEAVGQEGSRAAFDVAPAANLDLAAPPEAEEGGDADRRPAGRRAAAKDPHFWLDPQRYAAVATAIASGSPRPTRPTRRPTRPDATALRRQARRARRRVPHGPRVVRPQGPRHEPRRLRLPRRALRVRPRSGISGPVPRGRAVSAAGLAQVADFVSAPRGHDDLRRRPSSSRRSPRPSPTSTGARLADARPDRGLTSTLRGHGLP